MPHSLYEKEAYCISVKKCGLGLLGIANVTKVESFTFNTQGKDLPSFQPVWLTFSSILTPKVQNIMSILFATIRTVLLLTVFKVMTPFNVSSFRGWEFGKGAMDFLQLAFETLHYSS